VTREDPDRVSALYQGSNFGPRACDTVLRTVRVSLENQTISTCQESLARSGGPCHGKIQTMPVLCIDDRISGRLSVTRSSGPCGNRLKIRRSLPAESRSHGPEDVWRTVSREDPDRVSVLYRRSNFGPLACDTVLRTVRVSLENQTISTCQESLARSGGPCHGKIQTALVPCSDGRISSRMPVTRSSGPCGNRLKIRRALPVKSRSHGPEDRVTGDADRVSAL